MIDYIIIYNYNLHYNYRIFYKNQNDIQRPNIFKDRLFDKVQHITGIVMRQNIRYITMFYILYLFWTTLQHCKNLSKGAKQRQFCQPNATRHCWSG